MALHYTDRSRQVDGFRCQRRRWWRWHAVNGYGIDGRAKAVPLVTGTEVHAALADVLNIVSKGSGKVRFPLDPISRAQIRTCITAAQDSYRAAVGKVGLSEVQQRDVANTVAEQCALLEGLVWGWLRTWLNRFLDEFEIIAVEQEESFILGCTCGIGDKQGEPEQHEKQVRCRRCRWAGASTTPWPDISGTPGACPNCLASFRRIGEQGWVWSDEAATFGCHGLCQQSRPDFVTRRRSDGQIGIHDWKTIAYDIQDRDIEQYRTSIQMAVGTLGVERRLGKPVTHYYLDFLLKGARRKGYTSPGVFEGPKQQQSHVCYTTLIPGSPANPPMQPYPTPDTYATSGQWYRKVPVWTLNPEAAPKGWSPVEWLVEQMKQDDLDKMFPRIGPYDRQSWLIPGHLRSVKAEERRWEVRAWDIYNAVQAGAPLKDALDEHVPQSWDCWRYNSTCSLRPICDATIPTEIKAVMESGLFQLRVPHHEYEHAALKAAGVELPDEMAPTEEQEGEG